MDIIGAAMSYFGRLRFGEAIVRGLYSNFSKWSKLGFTPTMNTTESDIWSAAGVYVFPTAAAGMEVVSSNNTNDIGSIIKGDATGNTVQSDAGGSITTLVDADVDFTTATAVAAGDCIILDPHGTTPEWGYVTSVAAHTLTCSNGFSSGGTGASRYYAVIDYSAYIGAQAVKVEYLDESYVTKYEIVVLNGTTPIPTVNLNLFRVNSFRIIIAGSNNKPSGNLSIRHLDNTPVYSYITAGFTRARNIMYTVPAGKTLWVTQFTSAFGVSGTSKVEYCRLYTRANIEPTTLFRTQNIFYPYTEVLSTNALAIVELDEPTELPAKTDIRVSGIASAAGVANVVLRGYLETL